jgi:hypothetical protein
LFLDLPSRFSTVFDNEEPIGNDDRMDDEEQIGSISSNIVLPKKLWMISFFDVSYRRDADRGEYDKSEQSCNSSPCLHSIS